MRPDFDRVITSTSIVQRTRSGSIVRRIGRHRRRTGSPPTAHFGNMKLEDLMSKHREPPASHWIKVPEASGLSKGSPVRCLRLWCADPPQRRMAFAFTRD
jgi:hypothetical protein